MLSELRVFNEKGFEAFRIAIRSKRADIISYAKTIAFSDEHTSGKVNLASQLNEPKTRFEVGEVLFPVIGPNGPHENLAEDPMFWAWLSAAWMHNIISPSEPLKSEERWIPDVSKRKYYRHLLAGPFILYRTHSKDPSKIMVLLYQPISKPGEVVAQIHATNDLAFSAAAELANILYFDTKTSSIKKGAGGVGPGSPRRLTKSALNQLKVNLDILGMSAEGLYDILPPEFDRFKNK